mmetsp:Transcript_12292/g.47730  ORF Transcript_12292/g.47730 Transcript_12292/m.47730 type:complete len:319 (-) Transcript_12292:499-1455(-)
MLKSPLADRAPSTTTAALVNEMISASVEMPIAFPVNRTSSTATYPYVLFNVRPPLAGVCVSVASVLDMVMSLPSAAAPVKLRAPVNVVALVTARFPAIPTLPKFESTVNLSVATLKSPDTPRELPSVAVPVTLKEFPRVTPPVTPRVPPIVAAPPAARPPCTDTSPEFALTVNLVDAILKSPLAERDPSIVTAALWSVMISISPSNPMMLPVKRTDSTSTYPFELVIARPPVCALCVSAAAVSVISMSSAKVAIPPTDSVPGMLADPDTIKSPDHSVVPCTSRLPAIYVFPVPESTVNLVCATLKLPATSRVLDNVAA